MSERERLGVFRTAVLQCRKCGRVVDFDTKQKYCGDGSDKDNGHRYELVLVRIANELREHFGLAALSLPADPVEQDLLAAITAERDELKAENERLRGQLPEGMKHCTIQFKECEKGHGWLTATNWVQHGCPTCENERLRSRTRQNWRERMAALICLWLVSCGVCWYCGYVYGSSGL